MARCFVAVEQAGSSQQQRAAAHRGDIFCASATIREEREHFFVIHMPLLAETTRNKQHIEVARAALEGRGRLNAYSSIGHLDEHVICVGSHREFDTPFGWGELHGIGEQLPHDLLDPMRIAFNRLLDISKCCDDLHAFAFGGGTNRFDRRFEHGRELDGLHNQMQLARDYPRGVEKVFHDPKLCLRVPLDYVQSAVEIGFSQSGRAKQMDAAEHGRERGTQLM